MPKKKKTPRESVPSDEDLLSAEAVKPADDTKEDTVPMEEATLGEDLQKEESSPLVETPRAEIMSMSAEEVKPADEEVKPADETPEEEAVQMEEAKPAEGLAASEEVSREETLSAEEVKPAGDLPGEETVQPEKSESAEEAKPPEEQPKEEAKPAEEETVNGNGINTQEALKQAMDKNDEEAVLKLYAANPHQTCSQGKSLLHWAMTRNCHELIQRLSESGVVFDPENIHRELQLSDPYHLHHTVSKVLQIAEHQRIGFCQTHPRRPVQAWCNTCNIPICNWCMGKRGEHKDHDTDADLNSCLHDHKDGFLSSLQEVDEGVQALKDQCKIDASNGQRTINDEKDTACAGIDASTAKHADAEQAQNERDDEEIAKLQARIDELKAAKEERQRQRESFDQQAQAAKSSLSIDAQKHCEAVEAWQHGVLQKMDSAAERASTWRKAVTVALAHRPEEHIDMEALIALRARKETQSFLANRENLEMPTFPDAVQVASAGAQSACKTFQGAVNDTISDHSKTEKEKTLAFLIEQKVKLDGLDSKVTDVVHDAVDASAHAPNVIDEPLASAEGLSVTNTAPQDFAVGDTCECQDANANWWPVMINAKNNDGTFACVVSDGFNSIWPAVPKENLRRAPVAAQSSEQVSIPADLATKDSEIEALEAVAQASASVPTAETASESRIDGLEADSSVAVPPEPTPPVSPASNEKVASQEAGSPEEAGAAMQQFNANSSPDPAAALAALPVPEDRQLDEFEMAKSQLEAYKKSEEEREAAQKKGGRFSRLGGLLG